MEEDFVEKNESPKSETKKEKVIKLD